MVKRLPRNWVDIRRDWAGLSGYERFEAFVAFALTLVVSIVILVALYRLIVSVLGELVLRSMNPLEPAVFQHVFGGIMTLLIALEFNHTLRYVVTHDRGIIQAKIVILIAMLAVVRKVIVVDLYEATPASVAAVASLVLSLGVTYWLMRDRDDRIRRAPRPFPRTTRRSTSGLTGGDPLVVRGTVHGSTYTGLQVGRNESHPNGIAYQSYHVVDCEPLHHLSPMGLDRLGAELEPPSDVASGVAGCDETQDLHLPWSQFPEPPADRQRSLDSTAQTVQVALQHNVFGAGPN